LKIEYTLSNLLAKQPGGLTDNDYAVDADRSIRGRNWMQIKWNQFASDLNWKVNERTNVSWLCFGLYADRNFCW
jgi:Fe(3+) dicitrate transport protein